ncbi:MAG TPA: phosphatase PAP2 family protein [Gemmatimonadaceae bacterium]
MLTWIAAHQIPWIQSTAVEITALGTGSVVIMIALVAALFLSLGPHRYRALLLIAATAGGLALNGILKLIFHRPRPDIFEWGTHAVSSSFPSGHAMNAVIVYSTVAYLAARLESRRWVRWTTLLLAALVIALVCLSRIYLGVHYPSDIAAGAVVGFAWAAFCMSGIEAARVFGKRYRSGGSPGDRPPPG